MRQRHILLLSVCALLSGCTEYEQKIPQKKTFSQYVENPVLSYCGRDCHRCHNREDKCLQLLRENLTNLCDPKHQNCYELWVRYARRCHQYCTG